MDLNLIIEFLSGPFAYPIFFLVMVTCGLGSPINADLILLFVGSLTALGQLSPSVIIACGIVGSVLGDSITFLSAKYFGLKILKIWPFSKLIKPKKVYQVNKKLKQYGPKLIFLVRFIPGTRTITFVTSGIFKLPYRKFLVMNILGVSLVIPTLVMIGNLFISNLAEAENIKDQMVYIFLAVPIVFIIVHFLNRFKTVEHS